MKVVNGKARNMLLAFMVVVAIFAINISHPLAWNGTYTNYYGVEMTEDEYFTLLNLGFMADEIYYMTESEFDENKDLDATLMDVNTKYYKTVVPMYGLSYSTEVTLSEYLNHGGDQVLDTLYTYYREQVSTIAANGADKYRYKILVNWLNWPPVASYDVMAIGFINSVYISSPQVYFNYAYTPFGSQSVTTSTVYYDKKKTEYGGSVVYEMPSNVVFLTSKLYFDVKKNTNDTLTYLQMCGDYAHATSNVTTTQAANHMIGSGGIAFDASVLAYYDDTGCCYGAINGISW